MFHNKQIFFLNLEIWVLDNNTSVRIIRQINHHLLAPHKVV